jgi:hypothetical protein
MSYTDAIIVYSYADPDAWCVADGWLRYLELRAAGARLLAGREVTNG